MQPSASSLRLAVVLTFVVQHLEPSVGRDPRLGRGQHLPTVSILVLGFPQDGVVSQVSHHARHQSRIALFGVDRFRGGLLHNRQFRRVQQSH